MESESYLVEWARDYINHQDVFLKKIVGISAGKARLDIKEKDKERVALIQILLTSKGLAVFKPDEFITIFTINAAANLATLNGEWKEFIKFRNLRIVFVNPFSSIEKRWIISPHIHNNICDPSALKQGLQSMFGTVEPITAEELKKKIG